MKSTLSKRIFYLAVKTPVGAFLVILITAVSLFAIVYTAEVDLYIETSGIIVIDEITQGTVIHAILEPARACRVSVGTKVIWWDEIDVQRNEARVSEVRILEDERGSVIVVGINPDEKAVETRTQAMKIAGSAEMGNLLLDGIFSIGKNAYTVGQTVHLEIFECKVRAIEKLMKYRKSLEE